MPKAAPKKKPSTRKDPLASTSGNASRAKKPAKGAAAKKAQPNPARESNDPSQWNYLMLVAMLDMHPQVDRLLTLPPTTKFSQLHVVLQSAFGWSNSHMHAFNVEPLDDSGPPFMSLTREGSDFDSIARIKEEKTEDWTLADVYEKAEWKDKVRVTYEYDMGDRWVHDICVLGRQQPTSWAHMQIPLDMKAVCLTGHGHPVAEDCGGPDGWEGLKELFEKPRTKDEDGTREWYKKHCFNGDPKGLNPHEFDKLNVNDDLSKIPL